MKNWLKAGIGVMSILCFAGSIHGQNRQIQFETGTFREALQKAQEVQKMVFIDCYTSWCGPCKVLAKNVFTQDSVADFFNTHFVNFSIDMEKDGGKELSEKYKVEAYPTLLLIDSDGEEVFRSVGGCSASVLMSRFRNAMDPLNTLPGLEKQIAAGKRDPLLVEKYWTMLSAGRQFEKLRQSTGLYFAGMGTREICREENWSLYNRFVDIDNPLHHLMIKDVRKFKKLRGEVQMEEKLYGDYDLALMGRIPNVGHTEDQLKQYAEDIETIEFHDREHLFYLQAYLKIAEMKVKKQYKEYLDFMDSELTAFSQKQRTRAMMSLLMLVGATPEQRMHGNRILIREAQAIMKANNGTLPAYEQQMFGYVQFKLSNPEDM